MHCSPALLSSARSTACCWLLQSRVGCLEQGLAFLRHMGFREMDGYLVIEKERATPELVNETAKLLHDAMTNPFFGAL